MSLINKMLQDLEARSAGAAAEVPAGIDAQRARRPRLPLLAGAVAGAVLVIVTATAVYLAQRAEAPAAVEASARKALAAPAPPPAQPSLPIPQEAIDRLAEMAAEQRAVQEQKQEQKPEQKPEQEQGPALAKTKENGDTPLARAAEPSASPARRTRAASADAAPPAGTVRAAPAVSPPAPAQRRVASATPAAPARAALPAPERTSAGPQRAEGAYRRALAHLGEGRIVEATAELRAALQADPRHEGARQTLVGLLVEAGRKDEAMRELEQSLALEPRQPAMAMLLARMQIDSGASGIETLQRSLPHAMGNGEYRAFLAGALARAGRQREAATHYEAALRTAPQNGVWWMGLGLALQADRREPEAAAAFQKALDSGSLTAQLQDFVAGKLKQVR
ncbi:tetratricopeptide repeat protein [Massilia oculi]|uniref:Tetratricopeptide repeat protein n=1 Tax=Massilia hydrophila TaxID=3044279 RepID=A0ABS7Y958_9BURK|nr:tetratricopeptide repeat protein [Massilia oculi]MCA1856233.1 tetratricopeptide repeat protein [Massilia oculi]